MQRIKSVLKNIRKRENENPRGIAKLREAFEAASKEVVKLNLEAGRTKDFSELQAAVERLLKLEEKLKKAEAAATVNRVYEVVPLTDLTRRKIRETFPNEDQEEVISLLEHECGRNLPQNDPPNLANLEHIRLAVIKLADGNVSELRRQITIAQEDWRDVLIPAETPEAVAFGLVELASADPNIREEIETRDRQQYQVWLAVKEPFSQD